MNTEGITIEMNSADISQGMQSEDAKEVAEKETDIDDSSSESSDESDTDSAEKNAGDIKDHYSVHDIVQNCCTFAGMEIIDYFDREKTKVGLRVVRGVDWDKGNEDGGEGNIGTVVEVLDDSQQVRVQWDSQETINAHENPDKFIYRTGKDRKYELRLFDNAQTGVFHTYVQCDGCDEAPLRGMRWRCLHCEDCDLCTDCYMCDEHDLDHAFERNQGMKTRSESVGMRADLDYIVANGIFQDVNVKSRKDPKLKGSVKCIDNDIATVYNCDAKVAWDNGLSTKRYRVGREGKVDIKYKIPGKVPYFENHLQEIHKANATEGVRVVKKSNRTEAVVGTIAFVKDIEKDAQGMKRGPRRLSNRHSAHNLVDRASFRRQRRLSQVKGLADDSKNIEHCLLTVQWDNGEIYENIDTNSREILLLDNSQTGIKQDATCDGCGTGKRIKGVRWKCSQCLNFDLCTSCYMSSTDGHIDHIFQRITEPTKRTVLKTARHSVEKKTALGIFKGAIVQEIGDETGVVGSVESICHYKTNNARCIVVVDRQKDEKEIRGPFTDFQIEKDFKYYCYYPTHLPDLGKDIQGYIKAKPEGKQQATVVVELWYQKDYPTSSLGVQHSLYLIFANIPEDTSREQTKNDEHIFQALADVRKFAQKNRLPCQLAIERVLFIQEVVVIHKNTETVIIEELTKMGVKKFIRGDTSKDEDVQIYFQRMFQHLSGRIPLPACISMRNGVNHDDVLLSVSENKIPVISFKKKTKDVYILTMENKGYYIKAFEHKLDLKNPWKVIEVFPKDYDIGCYGQDDLEDEITKLEDISYDLENVDALICYLLIGVYMYQNTNGSNNKLFGIFTDTYPNALSMYLLKTGNWKIPRNVIKKSFSHRSIEFIFEEQMTEQFKEGLWKDLEPMTKSAYIAPKWRGDESDSDEEEEDVLDSKMAATGRLDIKISGLFGLIFFALLKKKYFEGAKQLIETGSVRIPHLLVGCVILQDIANDWQTSQIEKDKLLQMKMLCTQQALRITSCIHESDTKVYKKRYKEGNDADMKTKELGKRIDHAGRLLLNHGYLSDAIKTENRVYLNDDIVKKVINQMWYKRESLSFRRGLLFAFLTVFHLLLLPPLMITMENRPLQRLYRLYKVPVMKVLLNMSGWLAILVAYSYMLLFDFTGGVSRTHWFIIAWMTCLLIDEIKQIIIAVKRKKAKAYVTDWTNYLEWGIMFVYLCGMLVKFGEGDPYRKAEKCLLVFSFILMCVRFLNLLIISEIIGAKLVIIRKMFVDTFAFLMITTVITLCYSVSYYAILYSDDSDLSFTQIEKIIRNGFWILFGELSLESDSLEEPDCTFNKELYDSGKMERCPSELGLFLAPYLKAVYALTAIILLLNLLIAMYSHTFEEVHEKSKFYWSQLQLDFLEEYSVKTIFPIHFQLLVLPVSLVHFMIWIPFSFVRKKIQKCVCRDGGDDSDSELDDDFYFDVDDDELNKSPMFIRVFLYDKNFDLNLKETHDAEGQAALKASGDLETKDEDKITVLQRKMKRHKKLTRSIDGRTSKIMSEVMQIKKNIRDLHQAISPNTMPQEIDRSDSRVFNDIWGIDTLRRQRLMDMLSEEDSFLDFGSSDDSEKYDTD